MFLNTCLFFNKYGLLSKNVQNRHVIKCTHNIATYILPLPNNIDVAETTRFSPRRDRDISSTAILTQNKQQKFLHKYVFAKNISGVSTKQDPHLQSYDCFGIINLNSAMQSNVPSPFGGMHQFSHLNMPRGQLSQECKFMSQNLQNSHYTVLRSKIRSGWSTYGKNDTLQNKDSSNILNVQHKRSFCTKMEKHDEKPQALSKKDQLKKAFKDYGSTIVVFHITISLASLGGFYFLISSGIDVFALLESMGSAPSTLKSNIAVDASNFVIAYAIHKIFAPVRISITLGATPFIVRYLRSKGFLKPKI